MNPKISNNIQRHSPLFTGRVRFASIISASLMLACVPQGALRAQVATWNGPADGDWHTDANWSGGAVPTTNSTVRINSVNGPLLNSGTAYALAFEVAQSGTGAFTMSGDSMLISKSGLIGSAAGTLGRVVMSGSAGWVLNSATGVYLGLSGVGRLEMTDDTYLTAPGFMSIGRNGSGQGYLTMSGRARLTYTNSFFIGDGGNATGTGSELGVVTMSGSSQIAGTGNGDVTIGRNTNNSGTVSMSEWASWRTPRDMMIGENGRGSIILSGNSQIVTRHAYLGNAAAGIGSVIVRENAVFSATGNVVVGNANKGVLTLENGGHVIASSMTIASAATASGTLRITGTKAGFITGTNGSSAITITGGTGSAKIVFEHSDGTHVFANNLTGSLSVEHSGAGYTELAGTNNYTGSTVVTAGTLAANSTSLQGSITNDATVMFSETLGATGTYSGVMSGTGNLVKTGAGVLALQGDYSTFSGVLMLREGLLRLDSAAAASVKSILMTGGAYDGDWTPGTGQMFAGTGTITGNVTLTNATLGAGGDSYSTGILTIAGNLSVNDSTITFGCDAGNLSDSINLLGALTISGSNTIDINARSSGMNTYNLGNIAGLAGAKLTIGGADVDNTSGSTRQSASLSTSGNDLILTLNSDISRALTWTGGATALWNGNDPNWRGSESTTQFAPGDTVTFDSAADAANPARRTITIGDGPRRISDMIVSGNANYTFAGIGSISAAAGNAVIESGNPNGLAVPAGKLLKSGAGVLVFENTGGNNFAGGIEIAGGAIVFNRAAQLATMNGADDAGIHFAASGTLIPNADDMTLANKISIAPGATATLDTQSFAITYAGAFDETSAGAFVKRGDGRLSVTGTIRTGSMELAQGEVYLAPSARINAATSVLIGEHTLLFGGGAITTARLTNRGDIKVGKAAGAATHGSMTINGDYFGDGGKLWLDMALNAAGTGIDYDKLVITGDATGVTRVSFQTEASDRDLPNGVALPRLSSIISASGSTDIGAFIQDGAVEFGMFQYLWDAERDAWVADVSEPLVCLDAAAILIGKAAFESLQRRLMFTRTRPGSGNRKMELWLGGLYRREKLNGGTYKDTTASTQGVQAGIDWIRMSRGNGFVFGLYCDYAKSDMSLDGTPAKTDVDATGVGLYSSWVRGAWHVDAMLRRAREHYSNTPRRGNSFYTRGTSWGASLAAGVTLNNSGLWRIEPQVQMVFQRHRIDNVNDASVKRFRVESADSLDGRASVRLWRDIIYKQGTRRFTPYARASCSYEFQGDSTVSFSSVTFSNNLGGMTGAIEAGAELTLGRKLSINAAASWFDGAKTGGCSVDGGIRYSW